MEAKEKKEVSNGKRSSENTNPKSQIILAMALIAILAVLAIFVTTLILLQVKFKEPLEITLSDWLKMVLPIVGGAIVAIFAFLGVDRLKNFDERQDRLAKELRTDLHVQVDNAVKLMQPRLNEIYQEWESALKEKLAEYDKSLSIVAERIDKYAQIVGSVEKLEEVSDAIGNVEEAHKFITELFSDDTVSTTDKAQRIRILSALVERVKHGDIKGGSNDYHNLGSELAKQNYFEFASDVTKKGLELFDDNIDLLSDSIYHAHKAGRVDDVKNGIDRLEKIERNIWNWRAFTFYIDVLNDGEASEKNKNKALQCVEDYKRVLPDEERAYMAEYETFKKYGELRLAENALVFAEGNLAMTAQCSLVLAEIYHKRGEYDKSIESATRAIVSQSEGQPTSDTAAAFAYRGFARDAKIHKALLTGESIDTQYAAIQSAIDDYTMALKLGVCFANVRIRRNILQELLPADIREKMADADAKKRSEQLEMMKSLLLKRLNSHDDDE